jgi:prolyl 4-hydroxylase
LETPEEGGATVFPNINLRVSPVKNGALFWYNLYKNGTGHPLTLHSGCPVLLGSKWLTNKWLFTKAQELRKPCSLNKLE